MSARPPLFSIALLSAATLAYEILLTRLFSIIQWHHFAYLVIALALLGYGISGTLLSITQKHLLNRYAILYLMSVALFSLVAPTAFLIAQTIPFNMEELLWNPSQIIHLIWLFLLLTIPFIFAAAAICLTFMAYSEATISRIYMVDLLGAGFGSMGIVLLMYLFMPETLLSFIGLLALVSAAVAVWELNIGSQRLLYISLTTLAMIMFASAFLIELNYSPFKGLSQALQIKGARIVAQRASPLGHLTVVANEEVPLRHAPGLSLTSDTLPPAQHALFVDADSLSPITQVSGSTDSLRYLDQTTSAVAYHIFEPKSLLVVGSGTGSDLLQAQYHQVASTDALELNPQVVDLVMQDYAEFAGSVYANPQVTLHIIEAREFLSTTAKKYDLIQISMADAAGASSSGLYALNESYLYTKEALALFISHLNPGGVLSITRWIKLPPRDTLKLFATAVEVLQDARLNEVEKRLSLIRSWQTSTLLVKNGLFNKTELSQIEAFCKQRFFDLAYTQTLTYDKSNRFNLLKSPYFHEVTQTMATGDIKQVYQDYKFDIRPATDNRPYFHHFFKWESFLEALALKDQGGMPLIEWGYVVLILTLLVTGLISSFLILLPLLLLRQSKTGTRITKPQRWKVLLYFFGIGLAFLFIEIAFIQKFLRFLHQPTYAIAISLTAFLIFAGIGSLYSQNLATKFGYRKTASLAFLSIGILSLVYLMVLDSLFHNLGIVHLGIKIAISLTLIAPLAFAMGMPFPLALSVLKRDEISLLPWAWGINGYASVISAILATLTAIQFGFQSVILTAIFIYLSMVFLFPDSSKH
jgi:spermidine synthase